ncbi:FAD-dependent oxidoreductase [Synechococcus sp. MU1625]|uniref:FAD-dependent oxidoreductase n=1 Tax=Synechococcus sp. MU1625 TaxID=2508347 RepID=UPI001CF82EAC|nr:FAD-dependent oxidoreductase [Synechococcus sp. MU1625]MCB4398419.1 FAD-dependent oxidoreductase [Synechococcus sp. MU1625]
MHSHFDFIIVGGGIAGLFCGSEIIRRNPKQKVLLLDAEQRLGGRVHTVTNEYGDLIELGPMRILDNHSYTLALCNQLDIPLVNYSSDFDHSPVYFSANASSCSLNTKDCLSLYDFIYKHLCSFFGFPFFDSQFIPTINELILRELMNSGLTLKSCSFSTFVSLFFSSEQQDILWALFPYDHVKTKPVSLFQCLGAIDKTTTHRSLKPLNGFTSITSALSNLYHQNGGFSRLNCQVNHIKRNNKLINISTNHGDIFSAYQVIFAIPPSCILDINGVLSFLTPDILTSLRSIGHYSSQKTYFTFNHEEELLSLRHFHGFFRTDDPIRIGHWNPCSTSAKHHTVLAAYNSCSSSNIDYLTCLNKKLPFNLSSPASVCAFDWKESFAKLSAHFWMTGSEPDKACNKLRSLNNSIYFVGEAYCTDHGWINSALFSSQQLLDQLFPA